MNNHYLLTLKAEDRPGLLHLVTGVLNRKLIPIKSLTAAPTDNDGIVMITMEIEASEKSLMPLLQKLENIVEVFAAGAMLYDKAIACCIAFLRLDKDVLASPQAAAISKWGAQIAKLSAGDVIVSISGSETLIRRLYNDLDGPYLKGYCRSAMITDTQLMNHDDIEGRISRLAA